VSPKNLPPLGGLPLNDRPRLAEAAAIYCRLSAAGQDFISRAALAVVARGRQPKASLAADWCSVLDAADTMPGWRA
jgi:hypothetical protein